MLQPQKTINDRARRGESAGPPGYRGTAEKKRKIHPQACKIVNELEERGWCSGNPILLHLRRAKLRRRGRGTIRCQCEKKAGEKGHPWPERQGKGRGTRLMGFARLRQEEEVKVGKEETTLWKGKKLGKGKKIRLQEGCKITFHKNLRKEGGVFSPLDKKGEGKR